MKPIKIGPVEIETPVFLAPMTGVSDLPFRKLVKSFGAGLVFSEMIASRPMLEEAKRNTLRPADYALETPMAVQLAGCEPDMMAQAAKINEQRGAAIIDINFGCPVKKVVKNFAGSALMRDEPLAAAIMEETVKAVSVPVTVKMRLGWDFDCINAPRLARIAQDLGVQMVTIHGRTRNQLYTGTADWDAVRAVKDAVSIPVIINGDIVDEHTARMAIQKSGADGVMIGRGAYGRPWALRQIMDALTGQHIPADPDPSQVLDIVLNHYDAILAHYGTHVGVPLARKHIGWYCDNFSGADDARAVVNRLNDPDQVRAALRDHFANLQLPLAA
jgi:tRNA-dihydrouridine synthase B